MAQRKAEQQLLNNLFARIRELEDLYLEATDNEAPPSSFDLDLGVGSGQGKTRRFKTERARHATVVSEDMAALTHPIIKVRARGVFFLFFFFLFFFLFRKGRLHETSEWRFWPPRRISS